MAHPPGGQNNIVNEVRGINGNCIFALGTNLGLRPGSPVPSTSSENREAHGAERANTWAPAREALVFSAIGLGRLAAKRCKLIREGQ
jgi:hypothetical protein